MRWFLYTMQYNGKPKWPLHAFDYDTYTNFSMDSRYVPDLENIDILMHLLCIRSAFDDVKVKVLVGQLYPIPCHPTNHSLPGSSVHGILQARILQWVAISFSRGSSQVRDRNHVSYVSCTGRQVFTI